MLLKVKQLQLLFTAHLIFIYNLRMMSAWNFLQRSSFQSVRILKIMKWFCNLSVKRFSYMLYITKFCSLQPVVCIVFHLWYSVYDWVLACRGPPHSAGGYSGSAHWSYQSRLLISAGDLASILLFVLPVLDLYVASLVSLFKMVLGVWN